MPHKFLIIAIASATLSSCSSGLDDPTNIPNLGQWTDTQEVISISVNDEVSDANAITEINILNKSEGPKCGEPKFRTGEEFRETVLGTALHNCDLHASTVNGNITVRGTCAAGMIVGGDIAVTAAFSGSGTESPDEASLAITMYLRQNNRGDTTSSNYATVKIRKIMKRVGDC
jgi:hypothetical protein